MTAKRTFVPYTQLSLMTVFTIWVISLLCMINDFKFKAYYYLCNVSYYIEAEWNPLIWYCVSYLYYKSVKVWFSILMV